MKNKLDNIFKKINNLEKELNNKKTPLWKKNQVVSKLFILKQKYLPKKIWNSYNDGTYRKQKVNHE